MDHQSTKDRILNEGKSLGYKQGDMKVLSTDPYFVGSPKDYTDGKWVADLWDRMMASRRKPLHLRGFHYWIQSQGIQKPDGQKYAHGADPGKDWTYLLHSAQIARYLGIGTWKGLVDLKHPNPSDFDSYWVGSGLYQDGTVDIQETLDDKLSGLVDEFVREILRRTPEYHTSGYQVYHNEVWCEKNSMGFVIEPACRKFEACYQPLVGQASVEKVNMSAERAIKAAQAGKKVRIFYISDYDRYGWSMVSAVARKLEFFTQNQPDMDIKVCRLALNEEHIQKFNLPKAPKHGEAVVELDALEAIHPGELGKIVEKALEPYYDKEKVALVRAENKRMYQAAVDLVTEKLQKPLEETFKDLNVNDMAGDLDLSSVIDNDFEVPEPGKEVQERPDWVYDSQLGYWEQLELYKKYKSDREEEEM